LPDGFSYPGACREITIDSILQHAIPCSISLVSNSRPVYCFTHSQSAIQHIPAKRYIRIAMRKYEDTYQHKGLRKKLIDLLREKGITDENVLEAMNNIPRHYFLDSAFDKISYEDRAFPIAEGQTISQPYTVAYQTQLLQVKRSDKVLEIGTGSVYQATVLAEMGARVFTIERQKKLYELQKQYYFRSKYPNIRFFFGDGFEGQPSFAPFDKVIITAAAPFIPPKLVEQLKPGGCMVIPVDEGESQRMLRLTKQADGSLTEEAFEQFSFVPMLTGKNH
jgi:protein-L-isoaspartate(D-aspartate) O-methyltransferase